MDQEICLILWQVSLSLLFEMRNLQTDICGLVRLTKRQATSRPDHLWPELWTKLARNAKLREKQRRTGQLKKPKLDNARRLRGIYCIDPEDMELKEIIKNERKTWKHQWLPPCLAIHARKCKNGETRSKTNDFKSKFACILQASESTRLRTERTST